MASTTENKDTTTVMTTSLKEIINDYLIKMLNTFCEGKCTVANDDVNNAFTITNKFGNVMTLKKNSLEQYGENSRCLSTLLKIFCNKALCNIQMTLNHMTTIYFQNDNNGVTLYDYPALELDQLCGNYRTSVITVNNITSVNLSKISCFRFSKSLENDITIIMDILNGKYNEKYFEENYKTIFAKAVGRTPKKQCTVKVDKGGYTIEEDCNNAFDILCDKFGSITNDVNNFVNTSDNLLDLDALTYKLEKIQQNLGKRMRIITENEKYKTQFKKVIDEIPEAYNKLQYEKQNSVKYTSEQILDTYVRNKRFIRAYSIGDKLIDKETFRAICEDERVCKEHIDILTFIMYDMDTDTFRALFVC